MDLLQSLAFLSFLSTPSAERPTHRGDLATCPCHESLEELLAGSSGHVWPNQSFLSQIIGCCRVRMGVWRQEIDALGFWSMSKLLKCVQASTSSRNSNLFYLSLHQQAKPFLPRTRPSTKRAFSYSNFIRLTGTHRDISEMGQMKLLHQPHRCRWTPSFLPKGALTIRGRAPPEDPPRNGRAKMLKDPREHREKGSKELLVPFVVRPGAPLVASLLVAMPFAPAS